MKRKSLIIITSLFCLLIAGGALANGTTAVDWWVLGGGGGPVSYEDRITINATLGQMVIGPSSADAVSMGAGYWYGGDSTTAVRLVSFQAAPSGSGILVTWEMASEVKNLGFDLFRRAPGAYGLEKLNAALIPSKNPGYLEGASYAWFDPDVQAGLTYTYFLEDVDIDGQRTRHGPVEATALSELFLPLVLPP